MAGAYALQLFILLGELKCGAGIDVRLQQVLGLRSMSPVPALRRHHFESQL